MPDSASRSNLNFKNSSVLECPSCSTRFAVDIQQVAKIEEPIFHCSRCGHYFGLKDKRKEEIVEPAALEFNPIKSEAPEATQLSLMPESLNPEPDFTMEVPNKKITNITSWYKRNDIEKLLEEDDAEQKIAVNWPSNENRENVQKPKSYYFESEDSYDYNDNSYSIDPSSLIDPDFHHEEDEYYYEDIDQVCLPKGNQSKGIFSKLLKRSQNDEKIDKTGSILKISFLILSVPIIFAAMLTIWAFNINKTPAVINSLFNLDSKLLATVAPPGLALSSLTPEIVSLESGERAFRIKGDVINSTGSTFSSLTLEAKLFTQDNRELVRVIAPLDNSLRDTENISALNSESIERLQGEYTEELTTIQPNVRVPFSLVVPGIKGEEAWFSARIYSVKKI